MRIVLLLVVTVSIAWAFSSCKSAGGPPSFCDTICLKDSLKFVDDAHPLKPYVYISAANCNADTIAWSYSGMGDNRKLGIPDLVGAPVKLNPQAVSCFIKDTSYAWVAFNDCSNGRGYLLKIPFNGRDPLGRKTSAINSFDPKFAVANGLIAYSDRGNLFVEEMTTGKQAMMTFGQKLDINYDAIHEFIDSVNITPTSIWAKVKIGDEWQVKSKSIELK
ncbi:MAG: hypothetical protein E6Q24_03670 [Chitinophagaceae bacterium]|jgi:hypothetical protein|nr:hypothetical protein [Sphingobacteriales bacterium]OJV99426.1 MAG: hypothetical protein BGO52_12245 [Sphingobacteriales bacterium 44-61]TXJ28787.1 MAG: hypothetical protein E6Q24_03670 [Chitinophagaceae bacterium]